MEILIAGCGYVGTALAIRLSEAGHRVFGLRRSPPEEQGEFQWVKGNVLDPESLAPELPKTIEAVVYAASAGARNDDAYREAYVDGPRATLGWLSRHAPGLKRIVYLSSTGVYAQTDGSWVDEASPTLPRAYSGRRLLDGEELVQAMVTPSTIFRLSGIYGPGRNRLITQVKAGEARLKRGPTVYTNRMHRDDIARAIQHMIEKRTVPIAIGVDDEPARYNDVIQFIADELDLPAIETEDEEAVRGSRRQTNKRCRNTALRGIGFTFDYPTYRDGYRQMLQAEAEGA